MPDDSIELCGVQVLSTADGAAWPGPSVAPVTGDDCAPDDLLLDRAGPRVALGHQRRSSFFRLLQGRTWSEPHMLLPEGRLLGPFELSPDGKLLYYVDTETIEYHDGTACHTRYDRDCKRWCLRSSVVATSTATGIESRRAPVSEAVEALAPVSGSGSVIVLFRDFAEPVAVFGPEGLAVMNVSGPASMDICAFRPSRSDKPAHRDHPFRGMAIGAKRRALLGVSAVVGSSGW